MILWRSTKEVKTWHEGGGWQVTRSMREAPRVARIEWQLWGENHADNVNNHWIAVTPHWKLWNTSKSHPRDECRSYDVAVAAGRGLLEFLRMLCVSVFIGQQPNYTERKIQNCTSWFRRQVENIFFKLLGRGFLRIETQNLAWLFFIIIPKNAVFFFFFAFSWRSCYVLGGFFANFDPD